MAIILDGVGDYLKIEYTPITGNQDYTLFCLVEVDTGVASAQMLAGLHHDTGFRYLAAKLLTSTTDKFQGRQRLQSTAREVLSATTASNLTTYMVCVRWDESADNITINIDQNTKVDFSDTTGTLLDTKALVFGTSFGTSNYTGINELFEGRAQYVTSWHGVRLSDVEVESMMDGSTKPKDVATTPDFSYPLILDNSSDIAGTAITEFGTPTYDSVDLWPVTGPTITNIDGDDDVYPGQSAVITGTAFGATQGSGGVTLGGVAQTVTAWADTSITITVTQVGLKYGTHDLIVTDGSAAASTALPTVLSPAAGLAFVDVVSPLSDSTSVFEGASPAVVTGDQDEYDTTTSLGETVVVNADGTYTISGGGLVTQTFDHRVWDATDSTWGAIVSVTVNGIFTPGTPLPVKDGTAAPDNVSGSRPYDTSVLAVDGTTAIDRVENGLAMTANGRVCVAISGTVDRMVGGLPRDSDGKLVVAASSASYVANGVPFTASGLIAVTLT